MKEILVIIFCFLIVILAIDTTIDFCKVYWMWTKRNYLEKVYLYGYRQGAEDMVERVNKLIKEKAKEESK